MNQLTLPAIFKMFSKVNSDYSEDRIDIEDNRREINPTWPQAKKMYDLLTDMSVDIDIMENFVKMHNDIIDEANDNTIKTIEFIDKFNKGELSETNLPDIQNHMDKQNELCRRIKQNSDNLNDRNNIFLDRYGKLNGLWKEIKDDH